MGLLWAAVNLSHLIHSSTAPYHQHFDLVIGAKDDPLHLLKSMVYQTAEPQKNISGASARIAARHPQVDISIPLSFADNHNGFRIIGTEEDYIHLHGAELAEGKIWEKSMQAVAGAGTGLKTGDKFSPTHGYANDGVVHDHKNHIYEVTGILAPTGMLIDKLIITSVQSVYDIHNVIIEEEKPAPDHHKNDHPHDHSHDNAHDHDHDHDHSHSHSHASTTPHSHHDDTPHSHDAASINHEVTAILVKTHAGPNNLAHEINRTSNLTAVSPDKEINNLRRRLGLGAESFMATSISLSALALLTLLVTTGAQATAHKRNKNLPLPARPKRVFAMLCTGTGMGMLAGLLALAVGRFVCAYLINNEVTLQGLITPVDLWRWVILDLEIAGLSAALGFAAAFIPALISMRLKG